MGRGASSGRAGDLSRGGFRSAAIMFPILYGVTPVSALWGTHDSDLNSHLGVKLCPPMRSLRQNGHKPCVHTLGYTLIPCLPTFGHICLFVKKMIQFFGHLFYKYGNTPNHWTFSEQNCIYAQSWDHLLSKSSICPKQWGSFFLSSVICPNSRAPDVL